MRHFFEGWYFKHQNQTQTLALIPGFADNDAFIQIITDKRSFYIEFSRSVCKKGAVINIGDSRFSPKGILLDIHQEGCILNGEITYSELTPLSGDIMGPFRFFPMQCRHGVISLHHKLTGSLYFNGEKLCFDGGTGYIEKDLGRSFPKSYAWVHCNDFPEKCSVMAAIADIPFLGIHFKGIICAIWYKGKEYRLATYCGAKAIRCTNTEIVIQQGKYALHVQVENTPGHLLAAPQRGKMSGMVKENPSCRATFRFTDSDVTVFAMESEKTSFEFVSETNG